MSIELKIKSKHLALEAQVIRFEERKLLKQIKWKRDHQEKFSWREYEKISHHRRWDVRNENRATFLARAYIAGKPYKSVEQSTKDKEVLSYYIIPRITAMVQKYHNRDVSKNHIISWINAKS